MQLLLFDALALTMVKSQGAIYEYVSFHIGTEEIFEMQYVIRC